MAASLSEWSIPLLFLLRFGRTHDAELLPLLQIQKIRFVSFLTDPNGGFAVFVEHADVQSPLGSHGKLARRHNGRTWLELIRLQEAHLQAVQPNAVTNAKLANNAVRTDQLANLAVTGAKLANLSVSSNKLTIDSVTRDKIANGAVGVFEIAAGAVTSGKLAANSVSNAKLADAAVTSAEIADGTITADDIAPGVLTASAWAVSGDDVTRAAGKVGIGDTTPNASLHVVQSASNTRAFRVDDTRACSKT